MTIILPSCQRNWQIVFFVFIYLFWSCFKSVSIIKIASILLCISAKFVGRHDHFQFSFNLLSSIQLYPILSLTKTIANDEDDEGTADGKSSLMVRVRGTLH